MSKFKMRSKLTALILSGMLICQSGVSASALTTNSLTLGNYNRAMTKITVSSSTADTHTVGQSYYGFKLQTKMFSADLNSEVYEFVHEKTGGKLIYVANEDKNKWFNVVFKTPAVDDTGVNHILEHSVLEGSEKYNFKSPFTEMGKRSVSTFMNAFTGADATAFPIASENDQDFQNLMSVYLDATFSPLVAKNDKLLQQEGWRYEVDKATGKISFNGVVFNEMKGSLSDKYHTIYAALPKLLYPDTKYRYVSGGNPESIVDLSHAQLAATYKKYYNPSNACITLYGKMNINEKLKYISENYYDKYTKAADIEDKKVQNAFSEPKTYTLKYPADASATAKTDSILTWSLALDGTDVKDRLALNILSIILAEGDNSPLYKNTVEKGLGQSISAEFDTSYYQPMFKIMLEGADEKDMKAFDEAVTATLKEMVEKSIDKDRIKATLNSFELSFKGSLLSANKGDMAIDSVNSGFTTYGDPIMNFNQSEELTKIRDASVNGKYLESLIGKYLLNNKNLIKAAFVPDENYMANMNKNIDEKLDLRLKAMTADDITALKSNVKAYEEWQAAPMDQEALKALPSLKIGDLDLTPKKLVTEEKTIEGTTVYEHRANTLGLTRISLFFDLSTLTQSELAYIELFGRVLDRADTKNYENEKFANQVNISTSGFSYGPSYLSKMADSKQVYPYYNVETIFAKDQNETTAKLLSELLINAKLKDKKLVETKLNELVEELRNFKVNSASKTASSRLDASLTSTGALNDYRLNKGLKILENDEKNFGKAYPEIQKTLNSIYKKVFNKKNLKWSVTSDEEGIASCEKSMESLLKDLKSEKLKTEKWKISTYNQKTGLIIPSEVQYINVGFNQRNLGYKVTGSDLIFSQMLSDGYMYDNLRLKGGAYGGYMTASLDGRVRFISYRDPNLKESLNVIQKVVSYLKSYKPTQDEINNAIISVAGRLDQGADLFDEIAREDNKKLTKSDDSIIEKLKVEMLATKTDNLAAFIKKMEKGLKSSSLVVAGSENKIKENKKLFETIKLIQNK